MSARSNLTREVGAMMDEVVAKLSAHTDTADPADDPGTLSVWYSTNDGCWKWSWERP